MNPREVSLRDGDLPLEPLDELSESVADLGFLLELGLEGGEDGRVEEVGWVGHGGRVGAM